MLARCMLLRERVGLNARTKRREPRDLFAGLSLACAAGRIPKHAVAYYCRRMLKPSGFCLYSALMAPSGCTRTAMAAISARERSSCGRSVSVFTPNTSLATAHCMASDAQSETEAPSA